jgi:hypothetical protein
MAEENGNGKNQSGIDGGEEQGGRSFYDSIVPGSAILTIAKYFGVFDKKKGKPKNKGGIDGGENP